MIIDETFMWLYWLHKAGECFTVLAVLSGMASAGLALAGVIFFCEGKSVCEEVPIELGRRLLLSLWVVIPFFVVSLFVACLSPDRDELKAYAAYRIGERVVTSEEAKRMMDVALRYLEGGLVERQQESL